MHSVNHIYLALHTPRPMPATMSSHECHFLSTPVRLHIMADVPRSEVCGCLRGYARAPLSECESLVAL